MDKILKVYEVELSENLQERKSIILSGLQSLTVDLQNPDNRNRVTLEVIGHLKSILEITEDVDIVTSILRVYRNAAANCPRNQSLLFQSLAIHLIITKFLQGTLPEELYSSKPLALQVVGNSIAGNPANSDTLLSNYAAINWIETCLQDGDDKVKDYAAMIGLTLTQCQPSLMATKIIPACFQRLIDGVHLEFPAIWLESLMSISIQGFLRRMYASLEDEYKVKLLHTLSANPRFTQEFPKESLEFLIANFKNLADEILTMNPDGIPDEFNVLAMTGCVEFFCKVIHNEELGKLMKFDRSFVISTIALLRTVHEVGTSGQNCFTPIEKLESMQSAAASVASEPGFLFKADLIRLIGSLAEGNQENQDQVRELGLLPIILNCTKVDGRNPFIPQCSIVTLKFLMDGNPSNQEYVKQLQKN